MHRTFSLLLAFTVIVSTFSSCQFANTHGAVKFNDAMVKINQTMAANAMEWNDTLVNCNKTGQYSSLIKVRQKMVDYIQSQIDEVSKMDAVGKGGEKFRNEELVFLKLEKRVIGQALQPYEEMTIETTKEQAQAMYDNLTVASAQEQTTLKRLQDVQAQFAADNNFKLGQKDMLSK